MNSKTLDMIKKYCHDDYEDEEYLGGDPQHENTNDITQEGGSYPSFFSNPLIQTSFTLFSALKRIIIRKENLTMIHFLYKWRNLLKVTNQTTGANHLNSSLSSSITTAQNRVVIQNILNDKIEDSIENMHYDGSQLNSGSFSQSEKVKYQPVSEEKSSAVKRLVGALYPHVRSRIYFACEKLSFFIQRKKIANSQLTLLYLFAELSILKGKLKKNAPLSQSNPSDANIINKLNEKVFELERLNKKYESILDEKSNIIINKTDEIENLNEQIEELEKKLKKNKNLNVIQESLCAKCGNSLEESFMSESITESKKCIQEQMAYIEKLQKEIASLKEVNANNDKKLCELDEIKKEFKVLSEAIQKEKKDVEVQTEPRETPLAASGMSSASSKNTKRKPKPQPQKKNKAATTNVNIININNTSQNSTMSPFANSTLTTQSDLQKDSLTSLRFDNSVLASELLNLNKECVKLRSENRIVNDRNSKFEKEKSELNGKIKAKNEQIEKYKKENSELMQMINSSKYKTVIELENENKKLKAQVTQLDNSLSKEKRLREDNENKMNDFALQMNKMSKIIESYNSFKNQKENLILQNAKYETELKRIKFDLEESKNLAEKQGVVLSSKEKEIQKLTEDVNYYGVNYKKVKAEYDKVLNDIVAYQKIVRKMEQENELMRNHIKAKMQSNNSN